jgi:type II secretion system protein J
MCAPNDRPPAGFTLVELLVSLALLSLVLVLVYGAFGQISRGALEQTERLTERQELRLLLRIVADDLQSAQWLARYREQGEGLKTGIIASIHREGSAEFSTLSFHAAQPARFHRRNVLERDPGLHEVGYQVRWEEDGERLELVRREDYYLDDDLEEGGLTVVLVTDIESFLVEFLPPDADPNAAEEPWQDRWDSNEQQDNARMPKSIRLTLGRRLSGERVLRDTLELNLAEALKL